MENKIKNYQCPECKLWYVQKEWALKCEAWCREHKSCNLEITAHAVKDPFEHKILFVCAENAGRSQMAEAFFNHYAKEKGLDWIAESAGTIPAKQVNPLIIEVMAEKNLDLKGTKPKLFLPEKINDYERIISFGCLVKSFFSPEVQERIEEWHINDPNQKSKDEVRKIRNEIENRIINLIRIL